ncbi:MAG TPA: arylesterase, partial [Vicinamibacterales bacterium]|nr:arylesterase [Vicinamibacterales bacterium]
MTRSRARVWSPALLLLLAAGCSIREAACGKPLVKPTVLSESEQAAAKGEELPRVAIAILGDSLTAGFGLLQAEAYPALLKEKFDEDGYSRIDVINAGLNGDTTAGGLRRLEWVLEPTVKILVVALGANDAMRGQSPAETKENLAQIIEAANKKGVRVLLAGMQAPTNLGEQFQAEFRAIYPALAAKYHLTFLPFLLEGIAGHPELNQEDGIHPTAAAQKMMAEMI